MPDHNIGQLVEFMLEGNRIRHEALSSHELDNDLTIASIKQDYQKVWSEYNRTYLLTDGEVEELKSTMAEIYHNDLVVYATEEPVPPVIVDKLDEVLSYPDWMVGIAVEVDDVLAYGNNLYKVRQAHTTQIDWPPDVAFTLFKRWRVPPDEDEILPWIEWEEVFVGTLREHNGVVYRCLQAHVTQPDWTPPQVPALWEVYGDDGGGDVPGEHPEWQTWTAYTVGDFVTYNGRLYECRQSHTSQPGWEPPNVPALWWDRGEL